MIVICTQLSDIFKVESMVRNRQKSLRACWSTTPAPICLEGNIFWQMDFNMSKPRHASFHPVFPAYDAAQQNNRVACQEKLYRAELMKTARKIKPGTACLPRGTREACPYELAREADWKPVQATAEGGKTCYQLCWYSEKSDSRWWALSKHNRCRKTDSKDALWIGTSCTRGRLYWMRLGIKNLSYTRKELSGYLKL